MNEPLLGINYWVIKVKNQNLYLHKSSNMFTTDIKQSRKYVNSKNARKWIDHRKDNNDEYNNRFSDLEFILEYIEVDTR